MSPQNKNLLLRVASALVLLPLVLVLVWLGGWPFALLIAVAAGLCALEMAAMALRESPPAMRAVVVAAAAGIPLALGVLGATPSGEIILAVLVGLVMVLWIGHLLMLGEDLAPAPSSVGLSVLAVLYTGGLLAPVVLLRQLEAGAWWIVLVLAVTFLNDTGAYFAGRTLGRRKLYPRVSPAKTWEGFVGGLVGGVIGAVGVTALSGGLGAEPLPLSLASAGALGLVVAAVASAGDLVESLLKRAFSVKDSGRLIPGHGGMLDRLDAVLFTGPLIWLWALLFT